MTKYGTIFDLKRFAMNDGPGIRTTVFFKGCPMECCWCHNPESRIDGRDHKAGKSRYGMDLFRSAGDMLDCTVSSDELFSELVRDIEFYSNSGGGVTFSGGEPLMQPDFLEELLVKCRENNIHTAVDTCGYASSKDFERISAVADLFLFDIKMIDAEFHRDFTGVSNELILSNLELLCSTDSEVHIRVPLIPGRTDTVENLTAINNHIISLKNINKVFLLPYNVMGEDKGKRFNTSSTLSEDIQSEEELLAMKNCFSDSKFEVLTG